MPAPSKRAERTKVLSVRLTDDEFAALTARATEVGVGPSTLARTFVRQSLAATATSPTTGPPPSGTGQGPGLEARVQALVAADLVARVEALERRLANH